MATTQTRRRYDHLIQTDEPLRLLRAIELLVAEKGAR